MISSLIIANSLGSEKFSKLENKNFEIFWQGFYLFENVCSEDYKVSNN